MAELVGGSAAQFVVAACVLFVVSYRLCMDQ